jgi:hypothetical protein
MARTKTSSRHTLDPARNPIFKPVGDGPMEYLCLVYQDDQKLTSMPDPELEAIVGACGDWVEDLERNGQHVLSAGLQSVRTAVTVRSRNGKVSATDGPFAETKEHLGGFTLIRARDLNEAVAIASRLPAALTGSVEVRPLLKPDVALSDPLDRKIGAAIRRVTGEANASASGDSGRSTGREVSTPRDRVRSAGRQPSSRDR